MVYESEKSGNFWTEQQLRVYARQRVQAAQKRRLGQVRRRVSWVSFALLGVALAATVARSAAPQTTTISERRQITLNVPTQVIAVDTGDSLWVLAQRFGRPDTDLRNTVALISELNGGINGRLVPGQRLVVPR